MSRATYAPKETYTGSGTLDTYTFDFKIESLDQLLVIEVNAAEEETQRVRGTDVTYLSSVTFDAVDGGGTVVLANNLGAGSKLILLLANDEPTQPYEFRNKTSFTLKRFESALDFIAGAIQRLTYRSNQSLKIHDLDDEETFNTMLDPGIDGANNYDRVIKVNGDGTGFELGASYGDIDQAVTYAAEALASKNAAAISETNAGVSETNAANAVASSGWTDQQLKSVGDNNTYILNTQMGTQFLVDASGGAVNLYLPLIATINQSLPQSFMIKRNPTDTSGNQISITASGVDKINDASTTVVYLPSSGNKPVEFIGNDQYSPDRWQTVMSGDGAWNEYITTKGSLLTGDNNDPVALAVSSVNYDVIVSDNTDAKGLKYSNILKRLAASTRSVNSSAPTLSYTAVDYDPVNGVATAVCTDATPNQFVYANDAGLNNFVATGSPEQNAWRDIHCRKSTGEWVAVASSGTYRVASSVNGVTFAQRTAALASAWYGVTYSEDIGLWIACSYSAVVNGIQTSPDMINWTQQTEPSTNRWQKIASGTDGYVVACSYEGNFIKSTNGTSWTLDTGPDTTRWYDVAYGNGTWVAVGSDGTTTVGSKIAYNTDISVSNNWNKIAYNLSACNFSSVVFDNGLFYAVGDIGGTNDGVAISEDGVNWEFYSSSEDIIATCVADNRFLSVGQTSGKQIIKSLKVD